MPEDFSHYDVLGVRPDADSGTIRDAYRSNAAQYHPDVNSAPNAQAMMAMLNAAWETLRDPARRAAYDRRLATGTAAAKPPNRPSHEDLDAKRRAAAAAYERAAAEEKRARQEQERRAAAQRAADAKALAAKLAQAKAARAAGTRKRAVTVALAGIVIAGGLAYVSLQQKTPAVPPHKPPAAIPSPVKTVRPQAAAPVAVDRPSCVPAGVDVAHPTPIHLTATQLEDLRQSYALPVVVGFKTAIAAFLAGTPDGETAKQLQPVPRAALAERFDLMAIEPGPSGGNVLVVQFEHHPAIMYHAWLYQLGSGSYVVRSLEPVPCSTAEQRWLYVRYSAALAQAFVSPPAADSEATSGPP